MADPLQLPLKDIHLPAPVPWWPPAPGWWILIGLILLGSVLLLWFYKRRQRLMLSACNLAKLELVKVREEYSSHADAKHLVQELSILIRRLSISVFPRMETASLTGESWLTFLDDVMRSSTFTSGAGRILIEAPYRRTVQTDDIESLFPLCEEWIDAVAANRGVG